MAVAGKTSILAAHQDGGGVALPGDMLLHNVQRASIVAAFIAVAVLGLANPGYAMELLRAVAVIESALEPVSLLIFGGGLYMVGNAFRRQGTSNAD